MNEDVTNVIARKCLFATVEFRAVSAVTSVCIFLGRMPQAFAFRAFSGEGRSKSFRFLFAGCDPCLRSAGRIVHSPHFAHAAFANRPLHDLVTHQRQDAASQE